MTDPSGLIVVGLGPGDISLLTLEAFELLQSTDEIFVRTAVHPTVEAIRGRMPKLEIRSFDHLYESLTTFEEVYAGIVASLLELATKRRVVYGVPGSPVVDETTVRLLSVLSSVEGIEMKLVHGISYVEPVLATAGAGDPSWLTIVDAVELDLIGSEDPVGLIPSRPGRSPLRVAVPSAPLLISQVFDAATANGVKLWLGKYWPEDHEVFVVRAAATSEVTHSKSPIHLLDRCDFDHLTSVFVPAIDHVHDVRTFGGLQSLARVLRAPGGCPWDREQTHETLQPHLLEETYEVVEAIDERDFDKLCGELGDLLFQVVIHAQVAAEAGEFDITDVVTSISQKLVRRHPHVFADAHLPTSSAVLQRWESLKQTEMPDRRSILSSIPLATPALPYSSAVQRRAANEGFEWPDLQSLFGKVSEEVDELRAAILDDEGKARVREEFGDLLFALVSVSRWLEIDPEEALRRANRKFVARFQCVEDQAKECSKSMQELTPDALNELWEAAKLTVQ